MRIESYGTITPPTTSPTIDLQIGDIFRIAAGINRWYYTVFDINSNGFVIYDHQRGIVDNVKNEELYIFALEKVG